MRSSPCSFTPKRLEKGAQVCAWLSLGAAVAFLSVVGLVTINFERFQSFRSTVRSAGFVLLSEKTTLPEAPAYSWPFYRDFYDDLHNLTLGQAERHYWAAGRAEGRVAAPFRLQLEYSMGKGLCNQLYSHIHALLLARALGSGIPGVAPPLVVEAVLPPAWHRDGFDPIEEATWLLAPVTTLLDVDSMAAYWGPRGVRLLLTPPVLSIEKVLMQRNLTAGPPAVPFPYTKVRYARPPGDRCVPATGQPWDKGIKLSAFVRTVKAGIDEAARLSLRMNVSHPIPCFILDPGNAFMGVNMRQLLESSQYPVEAARGLFFNQTLEALAEEIIAVMDPGQQGFDGLHLRIEADAIFWTKDLAGGTQAVLESYYKAMKAVGFRNDTVVYAASGLLSDPNATADWNNVVGNLTGRGLASAVMYKEQLLPPSKLAGLHSEQLALLDFLVLLRARRLVGFERSSFSFMLVELRALHGRPKETATLINPMGKKKELFMRSAIFS